jgi:GWxTD domain-containing protein
MSHLAAWIQTPIARALGWTLVHFLWEGGVLAAVLLAILRLLRAEPARRRYWLACIVLAAMPVAFAITLGVIWTLRPIAVAAPIHWTAVPVSDGPIAVPPARFSWRLILDRLPWAVPIWFAGVAFFYARGLAGWAAARRLTRRGVCAPPAEWQARLDRLAARLRIARAVALLESCLTDTPVLIGYLRPVILLPLGCLTGLSEAQVECILLHELAHVVRRDYVVNLLQSLVEGLLFYHPAVWWVSRVVRAERENCCDDRVVELMGDARAYAATLAVLEQRRAIAPEAVLAANGGNLMKRIRRLTMESRTRQTPVAPAASAALLLVIFAAALTAWPAKVPKVRHAPAPAPIAAMAIAEAPPQQAAEQTLPTPYNKWLTEDVAYIITDEERAAFVKLTSDAERENFIDQFWKRRDPTPDTEENEYREEHYRRIAYANEHFAGSIAGWRTDRGRTYIVYGPPDEIDDHSSGGGTDKPYPYQQWRYRYIDGVGTNVIMEFADQDGSGDFHMTKDPAAKQEAAAPRQKWPLYQFDTFTIAPEDPIEDEAHRKAGPYQFDTFTIAPEERAAFLKLTAGQERENFIDRFWARRGSTAGSSRHYRLFFFARDSAATTPVVLPAPESDPGGNYSAYGPHPISPNVRVVRRHVQAVGENAVVASKDRDGSGEDRIAKDAAFLRKQQQRPEEVAKHVEAASRELQQKQDEVAAPPQVLTSAVRQWESGVSGSELKGVRVEQSGPQMVSVFVPFDSSQDTIHVFGEVRTVRGRIIQWFESDVSGQLSLSRAIPLPAGRYQLQVVLKNLTTGAAQQCALEFTVD